MFHCIMDAKTTKFVGKYPWRILRTLVFYIGYILDEFFRVRPKMSWTISVSVSVF